MIKDDFIVTNKLGLHTRAASKIVELTRKYACNVVINCNNNTVDGKSIIELLTLAATKGTHLNITISGQDEKELLIELKELFNNKFGEKE